MKAYSKAYGSVWKGMKGYENVWKCMTVYESWSESVSEVYESVGVKYKHIYLYTWLTVS